MERIRLAVFGLLLALGLSCCPESAMASDGFLGGLEDLTGTRDVGEQVTSYEEGYLDSYEPELREVSSESVRALPEDATTVDYVNDTLDKFNNVPWSDSGGNRKLVNSIVRLFVINGNMILAAASGLVFVWWGVRKSKNMIMSAFRKGKATL